MPLVRTSRSGNLGRLGSLGRTSSLVVHRRQCQRATDSAGTDCCNAGAATRGLPLLLVDGNQEVTELYDAQTTPNVYLVDEHGILRYRGAVNDRTFRQRTPLRFYLRDAVQALLEGRLPEIAETSPYGCAIVHFTSG
ncbi:MAG: hypothetical protein H6Q37_2161 [Chloroflexi bacterium]|nr:hypothetical protein [Chloroflexota bacterium]